MRNLLWFLVGLLISGVIGISSARAAECAYWYSNTSLRRVVPTPTDMSQCPLILMSPAEVGQQSSELWLMTPEQGAQVAGAILLLWAIAWVFRQFIGMLRTSTNEPE